MIRALLRPYSAALLFCALPALAQALPKDLSGTPTAHPPIRHVDTGIAPAPIVSPTVSPDHRITFTYRNPQAQSVAVNLEGVAGGVPMTRDAAGVWTVTTEPKPPEIYGYRLVVDGEHINDPVNANIRPNLINPASQVLVPGTPPEPWEWTDVPHGELHHELYRSALATDEAGPGDRDLWVYTPPGYDVRRKTSYPVLYLLHGFSDGAEGWIEAGKANLIMDTLLAQHRIEPLVVVMPRGYGTMRMISEGWSVWQPPFRTPITNQRIFTDMMLKEVLPRVEGEYHIARDPAHRAIAGLSMGGGESIVTGLNHPELFGYVGAFSAAISTPRAQLPGTVDGPADNRGFESIVPHAATQMPVRLFWMSCGTSDPLIDVNRQFGTWAKANLRGAVSVNETTGMHTWMVWRDDLITFSEKLWK